MCLGGVGGREPFRLDTIHGSPQTKKPPDHHKLQPDHLELPICEDGKLERVQPGVSGIPRWGSARCA